MVEKSWLPGENAEQVQDRKMIAIFDKLGHINDFFEKIIKKVYIFWQKSQKPPLL